MWGTAAGASEQRPLTPPAFRRELTPTWLSTCALLAGAPPLDASRGPRVLHLQCRSGIQAAVIAAVHPDATVHAFDDDPANVEHARDLATDAGLDNLASAETAELHRQMDAADDVDLLLLDDVVALSHDERSHDVSDIVRRRVRPGGFVAVTYRTESAWAAVAPLRYLARQLGDASSFAELLTRLRDGGARFVTARSHVRDVVEQLLGGAPGTVEALLFEDRAEATSLEAVSSWLASAGAGFVASARLDDELRGPLVELLSDTQDVVLREQLRDIAERPPYRIDLFRRGRITLEREAHQSLLLDLELVGVAPVPTRGLGRGERRPVRQLLADPDEAAPLVRSLMARGLAHPASTSPSDAATSRACQLAECLARRRIRIRVDSMIGSAIGGDGG